MNATDIVGFTADAAIWCEACAVRAYGAEILTSDVPDNEGNAVHPIFASDEDSALEHCGQCGAELVEHDCADHDEAFDPYVDEFTQAYAVAMLWANTDEIDDTGDRVESSVDPYAWQAPGRLWAIEAFDSDARAELSADCEAFVRANWSDLRALDAAQCGHDFALTRNHHGAGFWDRGLGEIGDRLTESSHAYGESSGYFTTDETEVHLS